MFPPNNPLFLKENEENALLEECKKIASGFIDHLCEEFVTHYGDDLINALKTDEAANGHEACAVVLGCP
jgi:hypothetical protein